MAEVNPVSRGLEHDLVHAHHIAFAKGSDLETFVLAAGFPDRALDGDGRARRRILFVNVMALEDLAGIIVAQGCCGGTGDIEK